MSYPLDLDEYTDDQLRAELARREQARDECRCTYCGRLGSHAKPCKFPLRHQEAVYAWEEKRLRESGTLFKPTFLNPLRFLRVL